MEPLTPLYDKTITCALCKKEYTTKKIRSRFVRPIKYDTDFFTFYENAHLNPLFYHVHVCPTCGYSATEDFSPSFLLNTDLELKEKVSAHWIEQDYGQERTIEDAIKAYKLALFCSVIKKEKHITIASILLRLSWLYRINEDSKREAHFMKYALHHYEESYLVDDSRDSQMSIVKMLYMIGELYLRLDNEQQATFYFSQIIQKHGQHSDQKIISMTRERWYELRERNKKRA
ncbi:DUF2225 domain-containing protein [Metabacillus iocasae]|uniref:Uncharacterized protein (DUF2225 family) n=1 Tax=Priestia iocasae TaxID=2291674 RepID=A0ABS2QYP7_9BACI|nr:DUF2225 domain-containing protein [Metabacillus iocasae]MBM7704610.1 uncharacterized protein (DUF2225 family) [Metabacillus iocasae]